MTRPRLRWTPPRRSWRTVGAALPALEETARTADTGAAAATAAVVKAEEDLRLTEQSVTTLTQQTGAIEAKLPTLQTELQGDLTTENAELTGKEKEIAAATATPPTP